MTVAPVHHNPVLQWVGYAQQSGQRWGIPTNVLLALIGVESGGREGLVSSAGAGGLTQFEPATARSYAVNVAPGHARSQIEGAAHYLHDLGFAKNPALALASYNAGPANPAAGAGYANKVLAAAKNYAGFSLGTVPPSSSGTRPASPASADTSSSDDSGVINKKRKQGLLDGLITVALVAGGGGLAWIGTHKLTTASAGAKS